MRDDDYGMGSSAPVIRAKRKPEDPKPAERRTSWRVFTCHSELGADVVLLYEEEQNHVTISIERTAFRIFRVVTRTWETNEGTSQASSLCARVV